ncbi:MAG: iron-containing alcohol dehydrogenase [Spirochaetota bacterium]
MTQIEVGQNLITEFKGDSYVYGRGVLPRVGTVAASAGKKAALVRDEFPGSESFVSTIRESLEAEGVSLVAEIGGAKPNCPREDLMRITEEVRAADPDVIISFGGGSTIDAAKAAEVLRTLGGTIDDYFGTGLVTKALSESGKTLSPHIAIQTVSSSGAHLTKYSNITDTATGQKKLIVDEAIVPSHPMFDYSVTYGLPKSVTMDGALDGIAHCLEVLYGAVGKPFYEKAKEVAGVAIELVGGIYKKAGYTDADIESLSGRELAVAVAEAMFNLARKIGFPTRLADVPGFTDDHIRRALAAAKDPQLEMKLKNMPVPLDASMIDEYMAPILEGARDGRLDEIRNV